MAISAISPFPYSDMFTLFIFYNTSVKYPSLNDMRKSINNFLK